MKALVVKERRETLDVNHFERPHRRLIVWQVAVELAKDIYQITKKFPSEEKFGLSQQLRRAGVSVASNIAEGAGRQTDAEKARFFVMAQGSLSEVDTQLEIARGLQFLSNESFISVEQKTKRLAQLISGLIRSRQQRNIYV